MSRAESTRQWSGTIRYLHWLTVALLGAQFFVAFVLMGGGMKTLPWLPTHLTLGFSLILVTAARAIFRFVERRTVPRRKWFAGVIHSGLYVALVSVVISGWLAFRVAPFSHPPLVFGVLPIPVLRVPGDLPWQAIHRAFVWILIALASIHVAAAGVHFLILRDRLLQGMKPWR